MDVTVTMSQVARRQAIVDSSTDDLPLMQLLQQHRNSDFRSWVSSKVVEDGGQFCSVDYLPRVKTT